MKQLIENIVAVRFLDDRGRIVKLNNYNLVDTEQRRKMGAACARWQSMQVGYQVQSEVVTIARAQEGGDK